MWKVFVSLIAHRTFLVVLAFLALNSQMAPEGSSGVRSFQPLSRISEAFLNRVALSREATAIEELSTKSYGNILVTVKDPFLWVGASLKKLSGLTSAATILILGNLFLLLFLTELYIFVGRVALPEVAEGTCLLTVLWITSYELSLGSHLSLSCYLAMMALRQAFDNQWLLAGIGAGLLALNEPLAIALLPVLVIVFAYFQRHFDMNWGIQHALFLLLPVAGAVYWNLGLYLNWRGIVDHSALFSLISSAKEGAPWGWVASKSFLGQTVAILIMFLGALASFLIYGTFVHKFLPMYLLLAVLATTPYSQAASALLLAALSLSGIAGTTGPILFRALVGFFLFFGATEIFMLFR